MTDVTVSRQNVMWGFGMLLAILASMSGTVGKQLMRFSELQRRKDTAAGHSLGRIAMGIGLALNLLLGPLIDMASYGFAPQSLIAPLGALDVVWNTMTAPCTLGERLTKTCITGCALIVLGATVTSLIGTKTEEVMTLDHMVLLFRRPAVAIYLLVLFLWLLFLILVCMPRSKAPRGEPWQSGDPIRGVALGMTAGSISGNMYCVKAFVELVELSIRGEADKIWSHWMVYVLFLGACFFAGSNLFFLTKAMREYEALFMGAVFEGSLITAAAISGCVVFRELEGQTPVQIALFWCALGVIIVGIAVVSAGASRAPKASAEESAEPPTGEAAEEKAADTAA